MNRKIVFMALTVAVSAVFFFVFSLDKKEKAINAESDTKSANQSKAEAVRFADFETFTDDAKMAFLDDQKGKAAPPLLADLALRAMSSPNLNVRKAAMAAITHLQSNDLLPVVRTALGDASAEMRLLALHEARLKTPVLRLNLLETAIRSDFADTRDAALVELSRENPKAAVPIMMEGLNSPDAEFRARVWQEILPNIQALRKMPFPNATEAIGWWNQVKGRFDDSMVLLDPSVPPSEN